MDKALIAEYFNRHFTAARWRHFANGRVALDNCLASPPSLLLLDFLLPDINGLDILRILRKDGHTYPVLVLTNFPAGHIPQSLLQLNANGYLDKQSINTSLAPAIHNIMDGRMFSPRPAVPRSSRSSSPAPGRRLNRRSCRNGRPRSPGWSRMASRPNRSPTACI